MPLTSKGKKIMGAMRKQYGSEKGKEVFYASKNKGKISGVDEHMDSYTKIGRLLAEAMGLMEKNETKNPKDTKPKIKPKGDPKKGRYASWFNDPYKRWWGPGPDPRSGYNTEDKLKEKKKIK